MFGMLSISSPGLFRDPRSRRDFPKTKLRKHGFWEHQILEACSILEVEPSGCLDFRKNQLPRRDGQDIMPLEAWIFEKQKLFI